MFQEVRTRGELLSVGRDAEGTTASLGYSGGGPLVWNAALPQGAAELSGDSRTTTTAELDLEGGFLRNATSSTEGAFDVEVQAEAEGLPLTGSLQLSLDLELEALDTVD